MRNYILIISGLVFFGISSCQKTASDLPSATTSNNISIVDATVVKTGSLTFTSKNQTGNASIYLEKNGSYILAFEQMQFSSPMDADVKFSSSSTSNTSTKLFSVKTISDHLYYQLPAEMDISSINYIFFQTDVSDSPLGSAILK